MYKTALSIAASVWMMAMLPSCSKSDADPSAILGTWRQTISHRGETLPRYYIFNSDNTYASLIQYSNKARETNTGIYHYSDQIMSQSGTVYQVKWSKDTVRLILDPTKGDDYYGNLTLVKDASPVSEATWTPAITRGTQYPVPGLNLSSLAYINGKLMSSEVYEKLIRVYNSKGEYEKKITTGGDSYRCITGIGSSIWGVSDLNKLEKLNLNGNVMYTAFLIPPKFKTMTSDGANLIYLTDDNNNIYIYTVSSNTYSPAVNMSININDMSYKAGYLYMSTGNYIYKVNAATMIVETSYRQPLTARSYVIAHDGTSFWEYVSDKTNSSGYFVNSTID
jgi:hypothetical protein